MPTSGLRRTKLHAGWLDLRSAVAEHAWLDRHIIEWDQVEILDTVKDLNKRKVKEALYIKLAP